MKILYCIRNNNIFNYQESFIEDLSQNGHTVHIVFSNIQKAKKEDFMDPNTFERLEKLPNISFENLISKRNIIQKTNMIFREVKNYQRYFSKPYQDSPQHSFYQERWEKYLPIFIRFIFTKVSIFKSTSFIKFTNKFFNLVEFISGSPKSHKKIIDDFNPDAIIATPANLRYSEEVDFIKYGKKKGIFSVISVLSWDNLTTKGGFNISPDKFIVWNSIHEKELINYHDVDKKNILILGSTFFDKWFMEKYDGFKKQDFNRIFNIKSEDKFIIYLGSSSNLGKHDQNVISEILKFLENSSMKDLIVILKPHLTNKNYLNKFENVDNVRVWRNDLTIDWVENQAMFKFGLNNAICSLGLNTTAMIDSVINHCPVISIIYEGNIDQPTNSAIHFKNIMDSNIFYVINGTNNLDQYINSAAKDRSSFEEKRNKFISNFIRPIDPKLNVGEIARKEIEKLLG
tara:strand:- start:122 stop:1492 length:1371 start_codon:yes stop_codon:yes gene_type:complete